MQSTVLLLLVVLISCFMLMNIISVSSAINITKSDFTSAVNGGTQLITDIRSGSFPKIMSSLVSLASPWLGVVGPLLQMGLTILFPGEPDTFRAEVKENFLRINGKLDFLALQQQETDLLITYSFMQARFSTFESNVHTLSELYNRTVKANTTGNVQEFINACKAANFQLVLDEVYQSINSKKQIFSTNIIEETKMYTKNSRKQVQKFMLGVLELFLKGIELRLAEYALSGYDLAHINERKDNWMEKLKNIKEAMENADKFMLDNYKKQLNIDVGEYITAHGHEDDVPFAEGFKNFLAEKYYWRYIFVQVFKSAINVKHQSYVFHCDGVQDYITKHNNQKDTEVVVITDDIARRDANPPSVSNINSKLPYSGWSDNTYYLGEAIKNKIGSEWCKSYLYVAAVKCDESNNDRSKAPYGRTVPYTNGADFWGVPDRENKLYFNTMDCYHATDALCGVEYYFGCQKEWTECKFCYRLIYF